MSLPVLMFWEKLEPYGSPLITSACLYDNTKSDMFTRILISEIGSGVIVGLVSIIFSIR